MWPTKGMWRIWQKVPHMLGSLATKLVTALWRIGRLSVLRTQKGSRLYHSVKPCNYNEKVCLVCHTSVHYPTEYVPRSTNLTQRSLSRVLSRIYHLGEKSRVAEGQELPRGGPEIFLRWRCAEMQSGAFWGTILRNVTVCALTSSRLDDFSDIVNLYTVRIKILFGGSWAFFWGESFYHSNTLDRTLLSSPDRGTQWICYSKYLFFRQIFAGWEIWTK